MDFKFVEDLRILCLNKILQLANDYGKTSMSDSVQSKKDSSWPLKGLKLVDKEHICKNLSQTIPLKNILTLKPSQNYWRRRIVLDFPSPHAALLKSKRERPTKEEEKSVLEFRKKGDNEEKNKKNIPFINFVRGQNNWDQRYIEMTIENRLKGTLLEPIKDIQNLPLSMVRSLNLTNLQPQESGPTPARGIEFPEILASFQNLKVLNLNFEPQKCILSSIFPLAYSERLAKPLAKLSLTHLSLYESSLDDATATPIVKALSNVSSLKCLDLRHNKLTSEATSLFRDALPKAKLEVLKLQYNLIDKDGGLHLSSLISTCPELKFVFLDLNPLLDEGSSPILEASLDHRSMTVLSMAGCNIRGTETFWNTLTKNSSRIGLQFLCLTSNIFDKEIPESVLRLDQQISTRILISSSVNSINLSINRNSSFSHNSSTDELSKEESLLVPKTSSSTQFRKLSKMNCNLNFEIEFKQEKEIKGMTMFSKNSFS